MKFVEPVNQVAMIWIHFFQGPCVKGLGPSIWLIVMKWDSRSRGQREEVWLLGTFL